MAGRITETEYEVFADWLFRRYEKPMWGTAYHVVGKQYAANVDDIVMQAFVRMLKHLQKLMLMDNRDLDKHVYIVTKYAGIDFLRGIKRMPNTDSLEDHGELSDTRQLAPFDNVADRDMLEAAAATLTAEQREILFLRYKSDLTFGEIGATIGINTEAARQRHQRAINRLRLYFGKGGVADGYRQLPQP